MTRDQIKDLARARCRYTGESYQQAHSHVAALPAGESLLPDALGEPQAAVESAVMNQLLLASRELSVDIADRCLPLPVQAVRPLAASLLVTVPINEVEQFAAMLCAGATTSGGRAGEAFMVASAKDVVTVALPGQPDGQVHLRCSWDRLRAALHTAPGVEVLSGSRLRVFSGSLQVATRPEHRAALSACLRRVGLFSTLPALSWLVDWNEWVVSDRRQDRPVPPEYVRSALTKSRFGPTGAEVSALLWGGTQLRTADAPRPRRSVDRAALSTAPTNVSPEPDGNRVSLAGVTFVLSAAELTRLVAERALPDVVIGPTQPGSDPILAAAVRAAMRQVAVLAEDLVDARLGAVSMIIGFQLPLSTRQVDVVLAGVHPETGRDAYVVVELKPWTHARSTADSDALVAVGHSVGDRLHPAVQVGAYCEYLNDFLGVLTADGDGSIRGAAYLYQAMDRDVSDLLTGRADDLRPVFTAERRGQFHDYLRAHLGSASGVGAAERLLASVVRPSRHLLAQAAQGLRERSHFRLLDEQRMASELVLRAVKRAHSAKRKTVVVVSGGPGSGKSVIGLSLLGELARQNHSVMHASGSRSFTQTLRRYVGRGSKRLRDLFRYFNSFVEAEPNSLDVLICDEAHRIRATSANRFTPKSRRERSRPQIEELIRAARVPVFLLDEDQVVQPGELGSLSLITRYASRHDMEIEVVSLGDQFRSGGSRSYVQWAEALLSVDDESRKWTGDGRFDLRMADSPEEMEAFLADQLAAGETARMSAGYCWPWSDPRPDDSLVPDVQIDGWARPWNAKSERSVGDAPGSAFWATDPNGFGQIGTVYTAQGFDYDWAGVIIGPDLVARDGRLVTRPAQSKDPIFRNRSAVSDETADHLIRNAYRVLMTRGMRGVLLYSTDPETQAFLASRT
ncbi:DNA/RNA helicase domain-containing protein [Micromonospora sp. NPDC051543]|uniref:DNA/RNA helicase domain-containing protein n=1 Tax=Micromonospora sp. NPDC051543 TaxID=3364287 RepID=UPI0037ACFA5C